MHRVVKKIDSYQFHRFRILHRVYNMFQWFVIFFFLQEKKPMSVNLQIGDKSYYFKNKTETIEDMENGHAYFALTGQNNQSYRIKMNNTHRLSGSPKKSLYNKASNTERKISLGSMSPDSECSIVCNYLKKIMGFRDPGYNLYWHIFSLSVSYCIM